MHVLHISNSYGGTAVYKNLYSELDKLGITQTIFVPLNANNHNRIGNQLIDFRTPGSRIIYSTALKHYHKFFYEAKIQRIVADLISNVNISQIDLIHASTQCLDGAAAYELNKLYGKPYIIAVRNTDVNNYYKIFFWEKTYFSKILQNAKRIIFISPKYKETYLNYLIPLHISKCISDKVSVIPNGVGQYFLEHRYKSVHPLSNPIKVIFISAFKKGKGLLELIDAILILRNKGYNITLHAIGKGLPNRGYDAAYLKAVDKKASGKTWITLEQFKQPKELCEELRKSSIFAMPSAPETFGLVYAEALTQNVPILYAQDQGFDGFYPDGIVGYPARPSDVLDIAMKLEQIIENYQTICSNIADIRIEDTFDWVRIASKYTQIYLDVLI